MFLFGEVERSLFSRLGAHSESVYITISSKVKHSALRKLFKQFMFERRPARSCMSLVLYLLICKVIVDSNLSLI